jgi:hypothetical protein
VRRGDITRKMVPPKTATGIFLSQAVPPQISENRFLLGRYRLKYL